MCHRRALLIDLEPRVLNQVNNDMPGLFNQARAPSPLGPPTRTCMPHARHMQHAPLVCHPNPNPNHNPNPNLNSNPNPNASASANPSQEEELKDER